MLTRLIALGVALLAAAVSPAIAADSDLAVIITNKSYARYNYTPQDVPFAHEDGKAFKKAAMDVFDVPDGRIISREDLQLGGFNQLFGAPGVKIDPRKTLIGQRLTNSKSRLYVFYSGHGMPGQAGADGKRSAYLMPVEADPTSIENMGYPLDTLVERLREIKVDILPEGQVILILDACFSGVTPQGALIDKSSAGGPVRWAPRAMTNAATDIVILSASQESEIAFWDERAKLGVFTHALMEGLYGKADSAPRIGNGDFNLTVGELRQFTSEFIRNRLDVLYDKQVRTQNPKFFGNDSLVIANYSGKIYPDFNPVQRKFEHTRCEALKRSNVPSQIDQFLSKDCVICECREALLRRKLEIANIGQLCIQERTELRRLQSEGDLDQLESFRDNSSCPQLKDDINSGVEELKRACATDKRGLDELKRKANFLDDLKTIVEKRRYTCASVHRAAEETLARINDACNRARKEYEQVKNQGDIDTLRRIARIYRDCPEISQRAERDADDLFNACTIEEKRLVAHERRNELDQIREIASKARCPEVRAKAEGVLKGWAARCATAGVEWEKLKTSTDQQQIRRFLEGLSCHDLRPEVEARLIALEEIDRPPVAKGRPVRECTNCPEVVMVRPGCFVMGGEPNDPSTVSAERPQVKMRIPRPFAIGTKEVTIGEWNQCFTERGKLGCQLAAPSGVDANLPMTGVSWKDAVEYVRWLSVRTKRYYRLPTEAEWEYAARAGTRTAYAFGDSITAKQARYRGSSSPAVVGSFAANAFGLYDMHGNVSELVADCFVDTHAGRPLDGSAVTHCPTNRRVIRGGSWRRFDSSLRSAWRDYVEPERRADDIGFRVAREITMSESNLQAPASCQ